jgi:hypothetical protein
MDHTEGFEDDPELDDDGTAEDDQDGGAGEAKKRTSSGSQMQGRRKSGGEEHRQLKRKKRVAAQLETLAEFVEYHLKAEESDEEGRGGGVIEEVHAALRKQEAAGAGAVGCDRLAAISAAMDHESNLVVLLAEACLSVPQKSGMSC